MTDDTKVRIHPQTDGTVLIWLPGVAYLDTQAGPVEIGLDREIAEQLRDLLDGWLIGEQYPMEGCNTSIACVMHNGCHRCRPAEGQRP